MDGRRRAGRVPGEDGLTRGAAVVVAVLALLAAVLRAGPASAHDLAIDQLALRPDFKRGTLRGQATFDPALTRTRGERALSAELEARALRFARDHLVIEVDGRPLVLALTVRELWVPAGATLGDTLMLDAKLPPDARELVVRVGGGFRALVVSVEDPRDVGPGHGLHSALVLGGGKSPPYRFSGAPENGWKPGPASQFDATVPAHREGSPDAGGAPPEPSAAGGSGFERPSSLTVARQYGWLGIVHIVPGGLDHMLFVLGLALGTGRRVRRLALLLSVFTAAHTATLALGALGWLVLPGSVVEPLIAASIAFVGVENALALRTGRDGAAAALKYRPFVVLAFGLLHGAGFAGALTEAGIPRETFVVSLLSFNVGVELGQLLVAAVGLGLVVLSSRLRGGELAFARRGSLSIALVGVGWTLARLVGG
jgi:hypothetical protein